jgi:hypothetical protein
LVILYWVLNWHRMSFALSSQTGSSSAFQPSGPLHTAVCGDVSTVSTLICYCRLPVVHLATFGFGYSLCARMHGGSAGGHGGYWPGMGMEGHRDFWRAWATKLLAGMEEKIDV